MPFIGELGEAGLKKEATLGVLATPPQRFRRFIPAFDFSDDITLLEGKGVSGIVDLIKKTAQGAALLKGGKMKYELDLDEVGDDLMAAFGTDTVTEVASFVVVTGTNDTLDFNIGAGNLVATVAAGTYKAGQTQADAGSLCAALYNAIVAAEPVGVYTVSYNRATGFFTITRSAGVLTLAFFSGPNHAKEIGPLIGFLTDDDDSAALTYTGDTAQVAAFTHAFSPVQSALLPSYSWWQKNGPDYPQFVGCCLSKLQINAKAKEFVIVDADWLGLKYDNTGITQAAVYSGRQPIKFDMCIPTVGGAPIANYDDLKVTIDRMVAVEHAVTNTNYGVKIYSKGLKVTLSMSLMVEDTVEWAKFIAGTKTSLSLAMTSTEFIKGAIPFSLNLNIPVVAYSAAPRPIGNGLIKIVFTAVGVFDPVNGFTILPTLQNEYGLAY